jgi:AcrR family transcriptional regulator
MRLEYHLRPRYGNAVPRTAQAAPAPPARPPSPAPEGLRERKKERTRLAIQDAALELFVEQGFEATTVDAIAERAEVSKATFFRYFATKGEVIFSGEGYGRGSLRAAIVARPAAEPDLVAVSRAIREEWVPNVEPRRFARQTRAASTSPLLRGLSAELAARWVALVAEALAERRGLAAPDARCRVAANVAFSALSVAVNTWVHEHGGGDDLLGEEIDRAFDLLTDVCREIDAVGQFSPRG